MSNEQEKQVIQAIGTFLGRVDLKGSEVQTFNVCVQYLQSKAKELDTEIQTELQDYEKKPTKSKK